MKTNLNKLRSQLNKKQSIAIAIILVAGLAIGAAILGTGTSQPAGDGHGHGSHAESKGHADTEHHGGQATDGHEHAKEHGDAEHHEEGPQTGPHGGKLFAEDGFSLEILLAEEGGEPRFRVWLFQQASRYRPAPPRFLFRLLGPVGTSRKSPSPWKRII